MCLDPFGLQRIFLNQPKTPIALNFWIHRGGKKMVKTIVRFMIVSIVLSVSVCAAFAQGQPSAKATFAYDELIALLHDSNHASPC